MRLVIDSNILIAALIKDSKIREIILESNIKFYHPKIALKNLDKYKVLIIEKSQISEEDYTEIYNIIIKKIFLIDKEKFIDNLNEAKNIMGNIDMEDVPFIALALSIKNDGIWSDDAHFKKQNRIKVFKTEEIIQLLKKD